MRWKSFLGKSILIILVTFLVSELALRAFGYTGIFSYNALKIILAPSLSYLILLENLILFLIVILFPAFLARRYYSKHPIDKTYNIRSQKSEQQTTIVLLPPPKQAHSEGKGLIYGALINIIYISIDFFLIRRYLEPSCSVLCGAEDLFAFAFSSVYFFMGIMFKRKG